MEYICPRWHDRDIPCSSLNFTAKWISSNKNDQLWHNFAVVYCTCKLPIRIETGRFRNEADERFCTFCNHSAILGKIRLRNRPSWDECFCDDGSVKYEKHFLLLCKAYHNLRHLLFYSVNFDSNFIDNRTFANLMTLHQRQTAKYLNLFL